MYKRLSGIYCIENIINNKKYIGQSVNIYDRWYKHKRELRSNEHFNTHLQNAWNKYGEDCFVFYIVDICDTTLLDEKEKYYISLYETTNRDYGYNLQLGGNNGLHSEESKQKISDSNKRYYDEEARKKKSEAAYKQWANPEIKAKILGENNGMYGKRHSEEAKQKMRQARLGTSSARRNRTPVFCIELNQEFEDAADAAKKLNLKSGRILKVCRGEANKHGGYHWKFISENNNS